jgi:hypothetical protein
MQKSLTISRKNFGNEILHGEKLEKFSFFSTGGFVVGGSIRLSAGERLMDQSRTPNATSRN